MVTAMRLNSRRKELGMSYRALADRSGVSMPTVKRVFSEGIEHASFATIASIANALDVNLELQENSTAQQLREAEAKRCAVRIVSMVQATSGLEAQAVDASFKNEMIAQTVHEILARPKSRLWAMD
jgi:transcriptional regulator with XRE-family HTH domain